MFLVACYTTLYPALSVRYLIPLYTLLSIFALFSCGQSCAQIPKWLFPPLFLPTCVRPCRSNATLLGLCNGLSFIHLRMIQWLFVTSLAVYLWWMKLQNIRIIRFPSWEGQNPSLPFLPKDILSLGTCLVNILHDKFVFIIFLPCADLEQQLHQYAFSTIICGKNIFDQQYM